MHIEVLKRPSEVDAFRGAKNPDMSGFRQAFYLDERCMMSSSYSTGLKAGRQYQVGENLYFRN